MPKGAESLSSDSWNLPSPTQVTARAIFQRLGPSGDFATALTIGDALVRSIANWVRAEARHLALPKLNIIEMGGGGRFLLFGGSPARHKCARIGLPFLPF